MEGGEVIGKHVLMCPVVASAAATPALSCPRCAIVVKNDESFDSLNRRLLKSRFANRIDLPIAALRARCELGHCEPCGGRGSRTPSSSASGRRKSQRKDDKCGNGFGRSGLTQLGYSFDRTTWE
ncbi:hypothetical protein MHYP_G00218740 [Metynnis hypsauchen]